MKTFPILPKFLRRKATMFALIGGLLTGAVCWRLLPPEPRFSMTLAVGDVPIFSPSMRYVAITTRDCSTGRFSDASTTTIWDTRSGNLLCHFEILKDALKGRNPRYGQAFTRDESAFVEFSKGEARVRDVRNGALIEASKPAHYFDEEEYDETSSNLRSDANGRLLILIKNKKNTCFVYDLFTMEKLGSYSLPPNVVYFADKSIEESFFPGVLLLRGPDTCVEAREILTGKLLFRERDPVAMIQIPPWRVIPHGTKRIEFRDNTLLFDNNGACQELIIPSAFYSGLFFFPSSAGREFGASLSTSGRYLLMQTYEPRGAVPPLLLWMNKSFGFPDISCFSTETALYDLETGSKVTSFAGADVGFFSRNNLGLAIFNFSPFTLDIYDLSLPKPWLKITMYSLAAASGVFLIGLLLGFLRRKKATPQLMI